MVFDRLGKPKPPTKGPTSGARRMLPFSAGSPGRAPLEVVNAAKRNTTIHRYQPSHTNRFVDPLKGLSSVIYGMPRHSFEQLARLADISPLPVFARPTALSGFHLEKTSLLFVLETLAAFFMGSPNRTRGACLCNTCLEPALPRPLLLRLETRRRSTKRSRLFLKSPTLATGLHFPDMANFDIVSNMAMN